jgi:hypothetical protein
MAAAGYAQSGKHNDHSAPYSAFFSAGQGSPVDLTNVYPTCRCATSGLYALVATAGATQLKYKDCGGNVVDSGSFTGAVGQFIKLPVGATELTLNTNLLVWAYWHPIAGR